MSRPGDEHQARCIRRRRRMPRLPHDRACRWAHRTARSLRSRGTHLAPRSSRWQAQRRSCDSRSSRGSSGCKPRRLQWLCTLPRCLARRSEHKRYRRGCGSTLRPHRCPRCTRPPWHTHCRDYPQRSQPLQHLRTPPACSAARRHPQSLASCQSSLRAMKARRLPLSRTMTLTCLPPRSRVLGDGGP